MILYALMSFVAVMYWISTCSTKVSDYRMLVILTKSKEYDFVYETLQEYSWESMLWDKLRFRNISSIFEQKLEEKARQCGMM